jgi:hypothetical protein
MTDYSATHSLDRTASRIGQWALSKTGKYPSPVPAPEGTAEPKEVLIGREHPFIPTLRQHVPAYPKEENQVKRHKIIWALGLTLLLSLALAACAQPATEAPAPTEAAAEPTEEAQTHRRGHGL